MPVFQRGTTCLATRLGLGRHESGQVLGFLCLENCKNFLFRDEKLSGQVSVQKLGIKFKI
jgi:hypothetical protein